MKKAKKYMILAAVLLLSVAATAQVFILSEEDYENSKRTTTPSGPFIPYQGGDMDQSDGVMPVGNGWLVLAGLGGAYLLGKRRKKE